MVKEQITLEKGKRDMKISFIWFILTVAANIFSWIVLKDVLFLFFLSFLNGAYLVMWAWDYHSTKFSYIRRK